MVGFAAATAAPQTLDQISNIYQHNLPNPQFLNAIIITTSKQQKQNVRPLWAYKRIPMEASGAYQLVDDATGDKFIVLGGIQDDDNDDEVSQETLDWNTNTNNNNQHPKEPIIIGGSLPSFARLKAPHVKSLINKNKSSKTRYSSNICCSISVQEAPKIEYLINNEADDEGVAAQEYEDVSVNPRASATNFRGWCAASVIDDRSAHVVAHLKHQRKKMEGDSGFFSRNSFKQLGCSDDMLDALRSLSFL